MKESLDNKIWLPGWLKPIIYSINNKTGNISIQCTNLDNKSSYHFKTVIGKSQR